MQLSKSQLGALAVFGSYFTVIGGLFLLILRNLPRAGARLGSKAYVFIALALASLAHTWLYMFKFMAWSFTDYEQSTGHARAAGLLLIERMSRWLLDTSLFEQAWASVCFGKVSWWWSQQLCLYTVGAWTIFLATEGRRHEVKIIWAYMLLGQLVAVSVASNLFYLALVLAGPPPPTPAVRQSNQWVPASLWAPVLMSLGTVATSPFTDERTFLPNLLLMHSLIVVPLVVPGTVHRPQKPFLSLGLPTLYVLVFGAALAMHTRTTIAALGDPALSVTEFAANAWKVLHAHPAQSSIGWDVIWTSISFVVWVILQPGQELQGGGGRPILTAVYLLLATPLVSVGVLAPHVLRPQQDELQEKKDA
ncbi:hypothetical protein K438DRAFT_22005 [Mycena galopus ATCC 62051]|nr:hypothetical protein K438DRAFT_22005 [Mycena galopus ATCC 62051]